MAIIAPILNTNPAVSDFSWLQEGYTYGVNDSGPWQRFKRRGLNTAIEDWAATLNGAGWTYTVTREKVNSNTNQGFSTIEANAGWPYPYLYGTETPENIWELDPQDEQKDLLNSDFPNGSVNLSDKRTREALAKIVAADVATWYPPGSTGNPSDYWIVIADYVSYAFDDGSLAVATTVQSATSNPTPGAPAVIDDTRDNHFTVVHLPSIDATSAYSLYLLIKAGNDAFPIEASIIRHSLLTSNLYAVQASYNNMGRLISTPSMYSLEGVPTTLLFDVPSLPTPLQFIQTPGDLIYAWRKVRPAISRLSRMKWRVTQNYAFGLYPVVTFGNAL